MPLHVILSPHPDDGPLTMGATMRHLASRGEQVVMITTMGGNLAGAPPDTPVVHEFHGTWNVGDDPVDLRRDEDKAACAVLGAEFAYLDILDCIYRTIEDGRPLYLTRASIFDTVSPDDPVIPLPDALHAYVAGADVIYAPLSIGGHIDHQIARGWAEQVAAQYPARRVLYYTDYPYAELPGAVHDALTRVPPMRALPPVWLTEADLRAKIDSIACYVSQISSFWTGLDDMEAHVRAFTTSNGTLPPHERFWEAR
jgi:LmbE family N-acetylglucosaminyl deacetylase